MNPHAPSGQLLSEQAVRDLAAQISGVVLLDEAYVDFVEPEHAYNAATLIEQTPNLLLLRTFSKSYALAGLRLGYLLGQSALIQPIMEKTRDSYTVDLLTQTLGLAAFSDREWALDNWRKVRQSREALSAGLQQLGMQALPSQTNFVLATAGSPQQARTLYQKLKDQHILVRYFDTPMLDDKLRISVGTHEDNQRLIDALSKLL